MKESLIVPSVPNLIAIALHSPSAIAREELEIIGVLDNDHVASRSAFRIRDISSGAWKTLDARSTHRF